MTTQSHRKVLVVDDEPAVCTVIKRSLISEGYEIDLASNGQQALELVESHEFEVALFDIMMPGMTGIELLGHIKRSHPSVYVIMVTAVSEVERAVEAMKLGAFDYITKPFKIDTLLSKVKEAREKRYLDLMRKTRERDFREIVEEQAKAMRHANISKIKDLLDDDVLACRK